MSEDPLALLRTVVDACDEVGVRYAVIGAVARNAWAPPRATTDLDLTASCAPAAFAALIAALERRALTVKRTISNDPRAAVPDIVLLEADSGVVRRLDLLIAKTPFELEAIGGAVTKEIGVACRVVRPEHLIVYKLIAGRARDLSDAEDVVQTARLTGEILDLDLIRRWTAEWGVTERLRQLLGETD
jgi:hypothetical protein